VTLVTNLARISVDICTVILDFIKKYRKQVIGIFIGAVLGYGYYFFIGCKSGSCLISSNPFVSVPYGALLGFLFVGTFKKKENASA
jgi:xanthine/uracil permease